MVDHTGSAAEQVRRLFDAKAATWPEKYASKGRLTGRLARLCAAVGDYARPPGQVLDLGCGTGELARFMAMAGLRTTACDISEQMICHAAALDLRGAVDWVQLDPGWESLPFGSDGFDAVVASSVLEYVDNPAAVLRECARVLRSDGVMLCTVPDLRHPIRWLEWSAGLVARLPLADGVSRCWHPMESYVTYLRISRLRRTARWWRATAAQAGLHAVRRPADERVQSPLRLLTLTPSITQEAPG